MIQSLYPRNIKSRRPFKGTQKLYYLQGHTGDVDRKRKIRRWQKKANTNKRSITRRAYRYYHNCSKVIQFSVDSSEGPCGNAFRKHQATERPTFIYNLLYYSVFSHADFLLNFLFCLAATVVVLALKLLKKKRTRLSLTFRRSTSSILWSKYFGTRCSGKKLSATPHDHFWDTLQVAWP